MEIPYKKVDIDWIDIVSFAEWMDKEQISNLKPRNCNTKGHLFTKNKDVVITFDSVCFDELGNIESYSNITVIPAKNVIQIRYD
jgi:hypothetical protein